MNILELLNWLNIVPETQQAIIQLGIKIGIFIVFVLLSVILGRGTPSLISLLVRQFAPKNFTTIYENLLVPLGRLFRVAGSLILIRLSLNFLQEYQGLFKFLQFFIDLAVIISIAWLTSRLFRQFVLVYGIDLINKLGREVDELILVLETAANIIIGFIAAVAFAQSQQINLVGLLASLGIGGLAIAFAAQKTLEQLLGTVVLYLDRPYLPGEYIRLASGLFGRVESIGLRSTKIRTAAKGTLMIIPNSTMADLDIENVSRGRKVMVLLYLNFNRQLNQQELALIEQVVKQSTNALFGIDPGSTLVTLVDSKNNLASRARITFFILGSSENSLQLRKRLLELANEKISKKLKSYQIEFTLEEPTIYVDSPITI
ncbi:MAG: mechanosensitive ion channel family protein [Pleurocapsa sp. MO_192.B19]|nr:mechanosensitive ion channel family protein [Pleurocapsa sp. MO_192.B19]